MMSTLRLFTIAAVLAITALQAHANNVADIRYCSHIGQLAEHFQRARLVHTTLEKALKAIDRYFAKVDQPEADKAREIDRFTLTAGHVYSLSEIFTPQEASSLIVRRCLVDPNSFRPE